MPVAKLGSWNLVGTTWHSGAAIRPSSAPDLEVLTTLPLEIGSCEIFNQQPTGNAATNPAVARLCHSFRELSLVENCEPDETIGQERPDQSSLHYYGATAALLARVRGTKRV
jgi:hypothetical protein